MDLTENIKGKQLRCGYTTGSCAAAAAKAAAVMLVTQRKISDVRLVTPKGAEFTSEVLDAEVTREYTGCAVKKYSGDDPDVTDGVLVYARVEKIAKGVVIEGGRGVGMVTQPGLDQPVGAAAINSVPREMITAELVGVGEKHGYCGGFKVVISVPGGEVLAARTFNPRMGIMGGISIIGTTGIVRPMSHNAIAETVKIELKLLRNRGAERVLLVPGNYGENFVRETLKFMGDEAVKCSNCIGEAVDEAVVLGFTEILIAGHIGKLVKLGAGITNTHSDFGDARMETLCACALAAGADTALLKKILQCAVTGAAIDIIRESGLLNAAMDILGRRIYNTLYERVPENIRIGFICFTNRGNSSEILCRGGLDYGAFCRGRSGSL